MNKIFYQSDLKISVDIDQQILKDEIPFEFRYFTNNRTNYVSLGYDGINYINCKLTNDGLVGVWKCPNFYPGQLNVLRCFYQEDERFDDNVFKLVQAEALDVFITDDFDSGLEEANDNVLLLSGEKGEKGDKGDKGERGENAAYPSWITAQKPSYTAAEVGALPVSGGEIASNIQYGLSIFTNRPLQNYIRLSCLHDNEKTEVATFGYFLGSAYVANEVSRARLAVDDNKLASYKILKTNGTWLTYELFHEGNAAIQQSALLAAPVSSTVNSISQPLSIEQPTQEIEVESKTDEAKYEVGTITKECDYCLYRYDITPNDGKFTAKEIRVYGGITKENIIRAVMESEFGKGYETNLINDYNAIQLGVIEDNGQIDRYKQFLYRREELKEQVIQDLLIYGIN